VVRFVADVLICRRDYFKYERREIEENLFKKVRNHARTGQGALRS
jgi:hypothetical protein